MHFMRCLRPDPPNLRQGVEEHPENQISTLFPCMPRRGTFTSSVSVRSYNQAPASECQGRADDALEDLHPPPRLANCFRIKISQGYPRRENKKCPRRSYYKCFIERDCVSGWRCDRHRGDGRTTLPWMMWAFVYSYNILAGGMHIWS